MNFQIILFQFITSTAAIIIATSKIPVSKRQVKNAKSSYRNFPQAKDLLEKTKSLLVMNAKMIAAAHAIIVEAILAALNLL